MSSIAPANLTFSAHAVLGLQSNQDDVCEQPPVSPVVSPRRLPCSTTCGAIYAVSGYLNKNRFFSLTKVLNKR